MESKRRAHALVAEMRALAKGDDLVLRLLDAIEHLATTRAEIVELSQLTLAEYEAAHERMVRLRAHLPRYLLP